MSVAKARSLRKRMTNAEFALWCALRDRRFHGVKFRRQVPVGPYVVDFVCREKRIVIEIDGGQHNSGNQKEQIRTARLEEQGYGVLRYWNNDVLKNLDGVLEDLGQQLSVTLSPHPNLLPKGEKEQSESSLP